MLEAVGVSKNFGRRTAVDMVDLSVPDGAITYLLGLNGAGKTTLMRMLCGLDSPTRGAVRINGLGPYARRDRMRELGVHLDSAAFNPRHTARRHLTWIARAGGLPRDRVDEVLDVVGLTDLANQRIGGLSLGMTQRVGIGVALLGDPKTLVFDEPANGLDVHGIVWTRGLFKELARRGKCVLVASHLLPEVARTADRIAIMDKGKLLSDTTLTELIGCGSTDGVALEAAYLDIIGGASTRGLRASELW